MKNKKMIIIGVIIVVLGILLGLYCIGLSPVTSKSEPVTFVIKSGESKTKIVSNLKNANLIKSKYSALIYLFVHNKTNIQAGTYFFNRNMGTKEIINDLNEGTTHRPAETVKVTFIEGKTILDFADVITDHFGYKPDEIKAVLNDKEFTKELIKKYWFLDDIVLKDGIYYALEGYLFPDTYEFYDNASIKDIIIKMLDQTDSKLSPYKDKIANSGHSVHDILSMAAIIEKEAVSKEDREKVSQVIYKRLEKGMPLGMDVTTYYAVGKDLKESLTNVDLNSNSPYNTRNMNLIGLPIGPICNPSLQSIVAALNPSNTNYLYFYADLKTGIVYFAETEQEFLNYKKTIGGY